MSDSDGGKDRGHWIVWGGIAALVLLISINAWVISRISDDVHKQAATNEAYREAQKVFENECAFLTSREKIVECFRISIEDTRQPARDEEDVDAQKQMAKAAWAMLFATLTVGVATSLLTWIGIRYVRENLVEMRAARGVSHLALGAARKANEQTERLLTNEKKRTEKELRAYVLVEKVGLKWVNSKKYVPQLYVQSKNFGQTPAAAVTIKYAFMFSVSEQGAVFKEAQRPPQMPRTGLILGPGAEKFSFLRVRGDKRAAWDIGMEGVKKDALTLYVVGQITYIDTITRTPRDTVFRFRYVKDAGKIVDTDDFSACEAGNYFT